MSSGSMAGDLPQKEIQLPGAHHGQVFGLLEILDDYGGKADLARIADDVFLELDDLLPASETAEILGLAKVDAGDITLTEEGKRFLAAGIRRRKKIIQQRLLELEIFKMVLDFVKKNDDGDGVEKDKVIAFLNSIISERDPELCFRWIVEWARHGLLLRYDSQGNRVKPQR